MKRSKKLTVIKVLWLAPNLNHYKSRFLNHLAVDASLDLCVFSGSGREKMGDKELKGEWSFKQISLDIPKKEFGKSQVVKAKLKTIFNEFDWVMIPAEKKNITLFLYAIKLRLLHKNVRLFSYNHPVLKSGKGKVTRLDKFMTKFYFRMFDRVVFYTEHSCEWALKNGFVNKNKAYWANNTVDTAEIKKHYTYQLPPENSSIIVFIGRLISSKRIPDLIRYYLELKKSIPNLILEIIGDGPESHHVKSAIKSDVSIIWHGTLIDEADIAPIMKRASLVFIPGHSGLSVNHAFSYGRPYITVQGPSHAPELEYLEEGKNGYVLNSDFEANIATINNLLSNRAILERFCNNARQKGECLSVEKWVEQMKQSLVNEK
ncbi:glycosyltransferase family 4 protein [Psychroserpens jangbogonensis]|uniref:glycosyltransferase family 4 protein n=1 Tax=Psychroserpens jangbogonensis TaxID=1484460 RepID=UPI00053E720F|nr:glycosyltransferase family 4 protein [Psychroserpens jangbogonensis]